MSEADKRSAKLLRDLGWKHERVEVKRRHRGGDLFGVADFLVFDPDEPRALTFLQVTTQNAWWEHKQKYAMPEHHDTIHALLKRGAVFEVWLWRKAKQRNQDGSWGKRLVWTLSACWRARLGLGSWGWEKHDVPGGDE